MSKTISYIILYAVLNVSGAALIKLQLRGRTLSSINEWFTFVINIPFITAFALIMFSALALFKALSTNNFSFIIPLATGVNFILTIVVGYYLFQDRLSPASLLGFVLIIVGIMVLSLNNPANAK
jgi:multidrug transporter EmrE-like cation transporter